MLKYWRVLILLVMVVASIFAIGLRSGGYRTGVEVVYIAENSPAHGLFKAGDVITSVNNEPTSNFNQWNQKVRSLSAGQTVTLRVNNADHQILLNNTNNLGITTIDLERTNLQLGLDLRGGTRIILKPAGNVTPESVDSIIRVLDSRANSYGLSEINFFGVSDSQQNHYIQVEAAGIGSSILTDLLAKQGRFEARVEKPVTIQGNATQMQLGQEYIPVTLLGNQTLRVENQTVSPNGSFEIRGITFFYQNRTGNRILFLARAYTGEDIKLIYTDPQNAGIVPRPGGFEFFFTVLISPEGAQRFADITSGIPKFVDVQSGSEYLDSQILLYVDDQLVSSLRIGASLAGQPVQSPQIQGGASTEDQAIQERLALETILRSGALPVTLQVVSADVISPTLGADFFSAAGYAALFAAVVVIGVVLVRYRNLKIAVPMALVSFSEIVIVLGISAANDSLVWAVALVVNIVIIVMAWSKKHEPDLSAWVGALLIPLLGFVSWTIDLPAIAGIIAAIGTGIDHQIIIADETLAGKKRHVASLREQLRFAFAIVFSAAATVFAAMLPLIFIGIGLVKGFAITTIIGVLAGVLITRPAYGRIVERIVEKR